MLLKISHLSKDFMRGGRPFSAIKNINLEVPDGEFLCITGRSGSGKNTLLSILAGLQQPSAGMVEFDGTDITRLPDKDLCGFRNNQFGYVPQRTYMLSSLTILDNVRLPFFLAKRDGNPDKRAAELLQTVGLEKLAGEYPTALSGGELRRAAIARALINSPKVLAADEPTNDLDEKTAADVIRLFSEINRRGTTVLAVTHRNDVMTSAKRIVELESGKLKNA